MYGKEIRLKVLELLESGKRLKEISDFLSINPRTIQNWIRRLKTEGTVEPKVHGLRKRKIDKERLQTYINDNPDKTLKEISSVFGVSIPAVFNSLKKMSVTLKKSHRL
jgi:transposase